MCLFSGLNKCLKKNLFLPQNSTFYIYLFNCRYIKHSLRTLLTPSCDLKVQKVNPMVESGAPVKQCSAMLTSNPQACQPVGKPSQVESLLPTMNLKWWVQSRIQKRNSSKDDVLPAIFKVFLQFFSSFS